MTAAGDPVADLWDEVVGQPDTVAALRAAARAPVHAYLIVGPQGAGKMAAARAFAAQLLCRGATDSEAARTVQLVAAGRHPCVTVVERDGPAITAEQARDTVRRAALSPPEGDLQVIVLDEFHLVRDAAPILLKSIEEPPPTTVFVVLAESVPDELVTVASRCVNVTMSAVPVAAMRRRLEAEGASAELAEAVAAASGGDLRRARMLLGDPGLMDRRRAWRSVRGRLDGTGATVCAVADGLLAGLDDVLQPLAATQSAELEEFEAVSAQLGVARKGDLSRVEARHKREARRVRTDELRSGLAALMEAYREPLSRSACSSDDADAFVAAGGAVQQLTDSLRFNPNESLALQSLLLRLPR